MIIPSHQLTPYQVRKNALILRELAFFFGTGNANPVTFDDWYARFGRDCSRETARKRWVRARRMLEDMDAPITRRPDGRISHLIIGREARDFAEGVLNAMEKYRLRSEEGNVIDGSKFLLVDMDDIEPPEDWEPSAAALERMTRSISDCTLGVIHPIILVGAAPPFHIGAGRMRWAGCRALGLSQIPARLLEEWDELIRIDENYVRMHYDQAEVENLRRARDQLIAGKKAEGKSNAVIAKELGVSAETVRRRSGPTAVGPEHHEVVGLDGKAYPPKLSKDAIEARRKQVRTLAEDGLSRREIAEKLDVSPATVQGDLNAPLPDDHDKEDEYEGLDLEYQSFEDPDWRETDAASESPWRCLVALDQALVEILAMAEGTDLHEPLTEFEELFDRVTERIRSGTFDYEPPTFGGSEAA